MPHPRNKLSQRLVKETTRPGLHADGGGLYLRVKPTGAKTWVYRYQRHGQRHDMGLGSVNSVTLAEAREKAALYRSWVRKQLDPIETMKVMRDIQAGRFKLDDDDQPRPKLVKRAAVSSAALVDQAL